MTIEWNKVTWYSKLIAVIVFVAVFKIAFLFGMEFQKLKSKGVKILEGPKKTAWGQTVAYFNDPDNNIWEISEK